MKYQCSITINLSRDRVVELFDDPENLPKWQEGLVSFTHISGEPGTPGATSDILFQMGKRRLEMVETIVERNLPDVFTATYEAKGVWNIVENRFFEDSEDITRWDIKTEFKCAGFMRVMVVLMPWLFTKQTNKMMADFKAFAETE